MRRIALAVVMASAIVMGTSVVAGAKTPAKHRHGHHAHTISRSAMKAKLLTVSDLPAGWSVAHPTTKGQSHLSSSPCLSHLLLPKNERHVTANFADGQVPQVQERLSPYQAKSWHRAVRVLDGCKSLTLTTTGSSLSGGGGTHTLSVGQLSFPAVGAGSHAWSFNVTVTGTTIGYDLVAFHSGRYAALVLYIDLGSPIVTTVETVVDKAAKKLSG